MRYQVIVAVLTAGTLLLSCKGKSADQLADEAEQKEIAAEVEKAREEAKALYGKKDPFGTPEDLAPTLKYGKYKWGEVTSINPESAKALIIMAFEKRVLPARMALRSTDKEKEKQAFEVLYRRTKESLKVHQCDTSKGGTQAICITSLDKWDAESQRFINRKSIQAFGRGASDGTWRPVAINIKGSKADAQ